MSTPQRLVRGNPLRETWRLVQANLPAGEVLFGIWRCEPGHWHDLRVKKNR